jgi:hypothetical protein
LNHELVHALARQWAGRLLALEPATDQDRIASAYRSAFAREPEPWETELALAFLGEQAEGPDAAASGRDQAWTDFAHMLFNVKEFLFIN